MGLNEIVGEADGRNVGVLLTVGAGDGIIDGLKEGLITGDFDG